MRATWALALEMLKSKKLGIALGKECKTSFENWPKRSGGRRDWMKWSGWCAWDSRQAIWGGERSNGVCKAINHALCVAVMTAAKGPNWSTKTMWAWRKGRERWQCTKRKNKNRNLLMSWQKKRCTTERRGDHIFGQFSCAQQIFFYLRWILWSECVWIGQKLNWIACWMDEARNRVEWASGGWVMVDWTGRKNGGWTIKNLYEKSPFIRECNGMEWKGERRLKLFPVYLRGKSLLLLLLNQQTVMMSHPSMHPSHPAHQSFRLVYVCLRLVPHSHPSRWHFAILTKFFPFSLFLPIFAPRNRFVVFLFRLVGGWNEWKRKCSKSRRTFFCLVFVSLKRIANHPSPPRQKQFPSHQSKNGQLHTGGWQGERPCTPKTFIYSCSENSRSYVQWNEWIWSLSSSFGCHFWLISFSLLSLLLLSEQPWLYLVSALQFTLRGAKSREMCVCALFGNGDGLFCWQIGWMGGRRCANHANK